MNKHPAEHFLRYLLARDATITDAEMMKKLSDWAFLQPSSTYWGFMRQRVNAELPTDFNPANRLHGPSMKFLRKMEIYDLFFPKESMQEAWAILADPQKRMLVEQALMARIDPRIIASKLNKKFSWFLTEDGVDRFRHFFWNVKLLSFDEWGRFLYSRTAMYDRHMALLQGPPSLAFFHLRLEQAIESKKMIQRVQEIAYHNLEEVNTHVGTPPDKIKAIGILGKVVKECHDALSTSDMALKDILSNFERFRMEHPQQNPPSIHELAPGGNFSGSGAETEKENTH